MTKISDKCKEYRKWYKSEIEYLIECTKLPHDHDEYCSIQQVDEVLDDTPEYNMSSRVVSNMRKKLYEK